jgi:hypothetical protein
VTNRAFCIYHTTGLDFLDAVEASIKSTVNPSPHAITLAGVHRTANGQHLLPDRNDPKLSHGAENRKRGFAANLQMKEQPPLAPARC